MSTFDLYFQGAEVPVLRKALLTQGVKKLGISYYDLREKAAKYRRWNMALHLPKDVEVFVSSGIARKSLGDAELATFVDDYLDFVDLNLNRITLVTEIDGDVPSNMIDEHRVEFWDRIDPQKFLPIWRGFESLSEMAHIYEGMAVGSEVFNDAEKREAVIHAAKAGRDRFTIHGLNVTAPELLTQVAFTSASTTGWLSPRRYGETHIWETHVLRRYPKEEKEAVRKRHRRTIERLDLDPDLVLNDDREEVTSLAIKSWLAYEEFLQKRPRGRALHAMREHESSDSEADVPSATYPWAGDDDVQDGGQDPVTTPGMAVEVRDRDEPYLSLPGVHIERVEKRDDQGNVVETALIPTVAEGSQRICDTCYVSASCPKYVAGHRCAFGVPVRMRTRDDLLAVAGMMLEIQTDRVLFARFAENLEGGFANPKVSLEIDRFWKNIETLRSVSDNSEFMKVTIEARGKAGAISRIFGKQAGERLAELPEGGFSQAETDAVLSGIIDAQVIEEDEDGRSTAGVRAEHGAGGD